MLLWEVGLLAPSFLCTQVSACGRIRVALIRRERTRVGCGPTALELTPSTDGVRLPQVSAAVFYGLTRATIRIQPLDLEPARPNSVICVARAITTGTSACRRNFGSRSDSSSNCELPS